MIDEDRTRQLFEYTSDDLSPQSNKKIVMVCEKCGKYRVLSKSKYKDLCISCALKESRKLPEPEFVPDQDRFVKGTGIDRIETIIKFGYDPINLSDKSGRKIVVICLECGKCRVIKRCNYRNLCRSCAKIGKVLTEEHKQKISDAEKGKIVSEETRRRQSARHQCISYDEWETFACKMEYCPKFDADCRESNRAKYNYECFICGKPQTQNITKNGNVRKLSVHHIDMDKTQGCGSKWKLVPLCMKCHPTAHNDESAARLAYLINDFYDATS